MTEELQLGKRYKLVGVNENYKYSDYENSIIEIIKLHKDSCDFKVISGMVCGRKEGEIDRGMHFNSPLHTWLQLYNQEISYSLF